MANNNPINTTNGGYKDYFIPSSQANKMLKVSTAVTLSDSTNWQYSELNEASVAGNACNPTPTEPLNKLILENISDIENKKVSIRSIVTQIPALAGSDGADVAAVKYTLSFYADDNLLEEFSLTTNNQPASFYSKIVIKLQP